MSVLDRTVLGRSGLEVSRVGFGGCPMGGHGWGQVDDDEVVASVRDALISGINFFDTADVYGLGRSEELLARGLGSDRDQAVIATKGGVRFDREGRTYYDNSAAWLEEALHASLKRLRVDTIDVYQVHYWDGITPLDDVIAVLERFRSAGKIRHFGVTNIDLTQHGYHDPVDGLVSVSFEYSMARRIHHWAIDANTSQLNTTFMAWGSLGQGVLSGKYDRTTTFGSDDRRSREVYVNFHGEQFQRNMRMVDALREILPHYPGRSVANLALRWVLDSIPRSIALVGIKNRGQLRDNAATLGWKLAEEHVQRLTGLADPLLEATVMEEVR